MYRIFGVRNLYLNNIKLLSRNVINIDKKSIYVTQTKIQNFLPNNKVNNIKSPILNNIRLQSTTNSAENIKSKKKRRRLKYAKYVELLQVTNLSTKQIRTKVKNLKAKKLQDFILKSNFLLNQPLPEDELVEYKKKSILQETNKKNKPQPIEYQKINLDVIDSTTIQSGNYDDKPLIFYGKSAANRNIDNPDDINLILKSLQNFKDLIETLENENGEKLEYSTQIKPEEDKLDNEIIDAIQNEETLDILDTPIKCPKEIEKIKKELRYKSKYHKTLELEKLAKQKSIAINLTSYLNVCVSSGLLNRAWSTLLTYRQRILKPEDDTINDTIPIDLFNIILHGFAEQGSMDKIENVCDILHQDNIKYNHQTYAAIFECLGRLEENKENIKQLKKWKKEAEDLGITLNMILDQSKFQYDQRDIVTDAIKRIEPDFKPIYTPPNTKYINPLLVKLNENIKDLNDNDLNMDSSKLIAGNEIMNPKRGFTVEQLKEFSKEQLKIELDGSLTVQSIEKFVEFPNFEECRLKLEELQTLWRSQICSAINRDLNTLRAQMRYKPHGIMTYYTYLKSLDNGHYADILLKEIRMLAEGSETYSPTVGQLYKELGKKVQMRYQIELKKRNGTLEKIGDIYGSYCQKWENCNTNDNSRQIWQRLVHQNRDSGPSMDTNDSVWPNNALIGVGRFLYNILMRDIKIDSNIMRSSKTKNTKHNLLPAFYTLFRNQGKNVKEEVKPHPVLVRLLRASKQKTLTFDSNIIPMLCPPQPWSTPINGGYLLTKSELIRLPQQAVQQWSRINEAKPEDMYPVLDSLNQLSSIPWRVNKDILDVILEVFNNGGDSKLDVPQPPHSLPPLPSIPTKDPSLTNTQRAQLFKQKMGHRRKQAEMYSLWCDTLYRLSLANHYRDRVFWLPHNMDFRGRVYPIPPHLNHLGSDLARSMLVFDQEQPLGTDGFQWLKLHCINLTGSKKRDSVRERLLYADEVLDDIIDSAKNPLTGRRWWTQSDEPWQTLSCCIEIAKVLKSPEPEKFMSRFPIHQDGSCNGLQHYAALGRDKGGAISVNLAQSPLPQDVYSSVAILVEKNRKLDAKNGLQVAQILDGYVRRKVIKQTVMTTVYGVTRYGARLQIARQLKDIDEFPKEWVWPASTYLTTKTFDSLREMFTSTKEIQDWFTDCARLISTVCAQNVEWITPLGFPVVQPYNRYEQKYLTKSPLKVNEKMSMDMYEKPNVMKQKNAFPPNFIHSLDSSHMMLTSLYCERKGITFISVHDCFWTHACTVPDMNKICREQFVSLHSQPIIEDLSKFLVNKYGFKEKQINSDGSVTDLTKQKLNKTLQKLPQQGDFNLKEVLDSIYFFS